MVAKEIEVIHPAPGDRDDIPLPDAPSFWACFASVSLDMVSGGLSLAGYAFPLLGTAGSVLSKIGWVVGKVIEPDLKKYLHALSQQISKGFLETTDRMNADFDKLSESLKDFEYKHSVADKVRELERLFNNILDDPKESTHSDFLRACHLNRPVDVLHTFSKRLEKGREDLNIFWSEIKSHEYAEGDYYKDMLQHINDVSTSMMACQVMYLVLEYKNKRKENDKLTDDDFDDLGDLLDVVQRISQSVQQIENDRKEIYFPQMINTIVQDESKENNKDGKNIEDRIRDRLKGNYPWHDFLIIGYNPQNNEYGRFLKHVESYNVQYAAIIGHGRQFLVFRITPEMIGGRYVDTWWFRDHINKWNYEAINVLNEFRVQNSIPFFNVVVDFRFQSHESFYDQKSAQAGQDIRFSATNNSAYQYSHQNSSVLDYDNQMITVAFHQMVWYSTTDWTNPRVEE